MRLRITAVSILAAALAFAAVAGAQDTTRTKSTKRTTRTARTTTTDTTRKTTRTRRTRRPTTRSARSTERIPISKNEAAPVVARVDTITVTRSDTVRVFRTDTVTNTITRVDTVQVERPIIPVRHIGGVYFGLAGGASFPAPDQNNVNKFGPRVDGILGYDPPVFPIGLRLNVGYSTHTLHDWIGNQNILSNGARFWDVSGDVKWRAPALTPFGFHFQMYGLGGGTFNYWKDLIEIAPGGQAWVNRQPLTWLGGGRYAINGAYGAGSSWYHNWGWNVGGGAQLGWSKFNVFAEGRFQRFHDNVNVANAPLVFGVNWY